MAYYEKVLEGIKLNKKRRLSGDIIAIPFSFQRLSEYIPGIQQGQYVQVTANSKVGKSQLCDYLYLYEPIDWYLANKDKTDIKLKIFYFTLEMSVDAKIRSAISYKLFKDYKIVVSPEKLKSVFGKYILDDEVESIITSENFQIWLKDFESVVTFYSHPKNPYGIFNVMKSYAEQNGTYTYKEIDWQNPDGSYEKRKVKDKYVANNPNEYVLGIFDHLSLLQSEKGNTLRQTMAEFSSSYCLYMRDVFNYTPIAVIQQAAYSEEQQFTSSGRSIIDKLKPTPDGLGDNKAVGRDCDLMWGLFHPARYGFEEYKDWDLTKLQDNYRELSVLFNRNGRGNLALSLYFNGACNYFKELPKSPDEIIYKRIEEINKLER